MEYQNGFGHIRSVLHDLPSLSAWESLVDYVDALDDGARQRFVEQEIQYCVDFLSDWEWSIASKITAPSHWMVAWLDGDPVYGQLLDLASCLAVHDTSYSNLGNCSYYMIEVDCDLEVFDSYSDAFTPPRPLACKDRCYVRSHDDLKSVIEAHKRRHDINRWTVLLYFMGEHQTAIEAHRRDELLQRLDDMPRLGNHGLLGPKFWIGLMDPYSYLNGLTLAYAPNAMLLACLEGPLSDADRLEYGQSLGYGFVSELGFSLDDPVWTKGHGPGRWLYGVDLLTCAFDDSWESVDLPEQTWSVPLLEDAVSSFSDAVYSVCEPLGFLPTHSSNRDFDEFFLDWGHASRLHKHFSKQMDEDANYLYAQSWHPQWCFDFSGLILGVACEAESRDLKSLVFDQWMSSPDGEKSFALVGLPLTVGDGMLTFSTESLSSGDLRRIGIFYFLVPQLVEALKSMLPQDS